jgi:teichuronic acid biosynthesis glycosyltransferase TuaH
MIASKRPIICLPTVDWQFLFHRPQQLMLHLARSGHPVHYRNVWQIPGQAPQEVVPNLWVYQDFDKMPKQLTNEAIYFAYFPAYATWIEENPHNFLIYDCLDDDPAFAEHENLMLSRADFVVCVSRKLIQKQQGKHQHLLYLPCGVDVDHYATVNPVIAREMNRLRAGAEAVIGFSGAFFNGWVDMELVYFVARSRPKWRIIIVGDSYGWDFSGAPSNIKYLGCKSYQDLPSYIRNFDIGWIPFLKNQFSNGADPIKLYEYIAAGLPVVSRELPFTEGLAAPIVFTYQNKEECLNVISKALNSQDFSAKLQRQTFAEQNSWDNRMSLLCSEIGKLTWLEKIDNI